MLEGRRIAVVIPARDEAPFVAGVIRGLPAYVDDVVVVDDASRDGTSSVVAALGDRRVRIHRHERARGAGAAVAAGYRLAFEAGADVAVVMAGDGQMDPADLPAVLAPVLRDEADYVKGDRLSFPHARRHMPLLRWMGNHLFSALTRLATGLALRDSQCGYTALARRAAARVDWNAIWPGYGYPNDLLARLAATGARIRDVVVRPVYGRERSGLGLRHALGVIPWVIARIALRRLLGGLAPRPRRVADETRTARCASSARLHGSPLEGPGCAEGEGAAATVLRQTG